MKSQRKIYKPGGASGGLNMQLPRKMSAQNVMASISRTLGTRHDTHGKASNEVKLAGEESKDKLYEPKHRQKTFRVMIVIAYVICVSLAAIILSLYYAFIWDPKDHRRLTISQSRINVTTKVECLDRTILTPTPENSESNGYHDEKNTKMSSQDDVELSEKLRNIYPPLPIHLKERQTLPDQTKKEIFPVLSTNTPPNISVEKLESNDSEGQKLNQYNLPKR